MTRFLSHALGLRKFTMDFDFPQKNVSFFLLQLSLDVQFPELLALSLKHFFAHELLSIQLFRGFGSSITALNLHWPMLENGFWSSVLYEMLQILRLKCS